MVEGDSEAVMVEEKKKDRHSSTDSSSSSEKKKKKKKSKKKKKKKKNKKKKKSKKKKKTFQKKKKKKSDEEYDSGDEYRWKPKSMFGSTDDGSRPWNELTQDPDRIPGPSYVPEEQRIEFLRIIESLSYENLIQNHEDFKVLVSLVDYHDSMDDPWIGKWWRVMLKWLSHQELETVLGQYYEVMCRRKKKSDDGAEFREGMRAVPGKNDVPDKYGSWSDGHMIDEEDDTFIIYKASWNRPESLKKPKEIGREQRRNLPRRDKTRRDPSPPPEDDDEEEEPEGTLLTWL
eukprot:1330615-Amphidinium_carterae.2